MLRIIQRCFGLFRPRAPSEPASETTVLLVRVPVHRSVSKPLPLGARPADGLAARPAAAVSSDPVVQPDLSDERLRTRRQSAETAGSAGDRALHELGILSPKLLGKLRRAGLCSASDLLAADPNRLVKRLGAPDRWSAKIRRYQRAIRFSRGFSEMTPHDALLLFAAHRRSPMRLAAESAGVLKRDLERLLLSSRGQKLAAGRPVPELGRVRLWIRQAQSRQERRKFSNRHKRDRCRQEPPDRLESADLSKGPAPKSIG